LVDAIVLELNSRWQSGEQMTWPFLARGKPFRPSQTTSFPHIRHGTTTRFARALRRIALHASEQRGTIRLFQLLGTYSLPHTTHIFGFMERSIASGDGEHLVSGPQPASGYTPARREEGVVGRTNDALAVGQGDAQESRGAPGENLRDVPQFDGAGRVVETLDGIANADLLDGPTVHRRAGRKTLIDHQEAELVGIEPVHPGIAVAPGALGLNGRDDDARAAPERAVVRPHLGHLNVGLCAGDGRDLVGGLEDEFLAVREDERAAPGQTMDDVGEGHRLARARGLHEER
jgi:hypothetical protein